MSPPPKDGLLLELEQEAPVHQSTDILFAPWDAGIPFGRLRGLCRGEMAKFLVDTLTQDTLADVMGFLNAWGTPIKRSDS